MAKNVDAFSLLVLLACSTAPLVHASAPQIFQRDSLPEGFQKAQLQNPGQDVQKKHFRGSKMPQQQRAMEATEAGFRAYYIGSFRNYVSAACRAKVPISLRASCRGGKIDFLGHGYTSTFITCDRISPTDSEPGWDEIRCISGSAYTNDDEDSIDWTDILFTCTGPEVGDVEARFIYEDNGPGGSCFIGFFGSATDNFRMAQLGVYCNEDASFNYDPAFFECGANSWPNDPNGRYTCHYGENGRRRENIEWEDLTVESDVHRYRPDCIAVVDSFGNETIDMDLELPAAPDITPVPIGTYKARFRTHFYLRETDYSFTEMEGPSTITVQCTTLGSEISLSRKDDGFECLKVADDTLVCTTMDYGNVSPRDWNFGSFDYECESPQLPEVKATYEENAIKYGSPFASDVDYAFPYLAMAVYCDGDPAPHEHAPYHYDYFFRCPNNEGSTWDQYDIDSIPRCFGKGAFVNETGPDAPFFTIPSFSMYTDYRWSQHAFSTCYEFTTPVPSSEPSTSSEPSVSSVPSDIPTLSSQPSSSPSQSCTSGNKCDICEGDCDNDSHCASGLYCHQRSGTTAVPGCLGLGYSDADYCTRILSTGSLQDFSGVASCTAQAPCGACQGTCVGDSSCQGHLVCVDALSNGQVPGCSGLATEGSKYCAKAVPDGTLQDYGFSGCSRTHPCGACQGDCDFDSHCEGDLICHQRDGFAAVPGCEGDGVGDADYCIHP